MKPLSAVFADNSSAFGEFKILSVIQFTDFCSVACQPLAGLPAVFMEGLTPLFLLLVVSETKLDVPFFSIR
jgi:hypothetical protein